MNKIRLIGVAGTIINTNTSNDESNISFTIYVQRSAGVYDTLIVNTSADHTAIIETADKLEVVGKVMNKDDSILMHCIQADNITPATGDDVNEVFIDGIISSEPYRKEINSKPLTSFILAADTLHPVTIPCRVWQDLRLSEGAAVTVKGSLQPRDYWNGNRLIELSEIVCNEVIAK